MNITAGTFAVLTVVLALSTPPAAQAEEKTEKKSHYLVFVGTYTTKTESKGVYVFRYDGDSGKVNEAGRNSMISAFRLDAHTGKLTLLNQLPALGEDPCYLSFDRGGKYALVANYTSGNVVVFPIGTDGQLGPATANVRDEGQLGPNKERQEGPHAHWIETSASNRYAYVADLGLDKVLIYKFDAAAGNLATPEATQPGSFSATLAPGSGPRHLAFSRNGSFMYVLGEVRSTVTVFENDARETYRELQTVSLLPESFSGRNDAAEITIHPNGKFLYASNRGHESIALFRVDAGTGKLTVAGDFSVEGKEPRNFVIDPSGAFLLAADQLSNKIVTFRIDQKTGALTPTRETVHVPSPVCIAFLAVE